MAKQLNVNLAFTADASQAKGQLQELQNQLNKIATQPLSGSGFKTITPEIQKASAAAAELSVHLEKATNVNTGTLDFSRLNQSLKKSGTSLSEYATKIKNIGPQGQQAFMMLAQSVANAEVPIRRSNGLLTEMATTLKNTARWQISSSILHGFMGAVQSAYGYTQKLNESLNNIRIVTGKSSEEMAQFADKANKAAKALSATTTQYTDAALIYYQQGLDGTQVEQRAETTLKLANVSRQSAEVVSDQMTAIWNNFDDGSKSLEYYADVLTALGATTASSTDEIAQGLEKFAAVAETVGLSYEYATAALATVTAETRQSADVVGTAFKTLFARMEGLKLGETLEDGTDLNKYSEALASVGINIKDSNGELKDMDIILDDMGSKWQTLSKDQQVALAQTVGGMRQYNQLIALMGNWDKFQENLNTAYNSTGTLDEQAETYAESWEAAQKRVTAAAQAIYSKIIDDDFFIGVLNTIEDLLTGFDKLIDSAGGFTGIISSLGLVLTKVFEKQMAEGLRNAAYNLKMMTEFGRQKEQEAKSQSLKELAAIMKNSAVGESATPTVDATASQVYEKQLLLQEEFISNQEKMSEFDQRKVQHLMDQLKLQGEQSLELAKQVDLAKDQRSDKAVEIKAKSTQDGKTTQKAMDQVRGVTTEATKIEEILKRTSQGAKMTSEDMDEIVQAFGRMNNFNPNLISTEDLKEIEDLLAGTDNLEQNLEDIRAKAEKLKTVTIERTASQLDVDESEMREYSDSVQQVETKTRQLNTANKNLEQSQDGVSKAIKKSKGETLDWANRLTGIAQGIMGITSLISAMKGAVDALTNPDLSGWEKFWSVLSSAGMIMTTLIMTISSLKTAFGGLTKAKVADSLATGLNTVSEWLNAKATKAAAAAKDKKERETKETTAATNKDTAANVANAASDKLANKTDVGKGSGVGGAGKNLGSSVKNLGKSLKSLISSYKGAIGGVALIAAGVAVAIGATTLAINHYNKEMNEAKKATDAARQAGEALQSVMSSYTEFTNTLSSYKDAQEGLKGLSEGTNEYREAVIKANDEAIKLLDTYEDLKYHTNEDGLIIIDQESLKDVQEKQLQQIESAQRSKLLADQVASEKTLEAEKTKFKRKELYSESDSKMMLANTAGGLLVGGGSGALIGAGIGMLGGPIGVLAGAIIGGIAGAVTGAIGTAVAGTQTSEEEKALQLLATEYSNSGNAIFASNKSLENALLELGITDKKLIDSLVRNKEATEKLVKSMNEEKNREHTSQENLIKSEFAEDLSKLSGEVATNTASSLAYELDSRKETILNDYSNRDIKQLQKEYAMAMGWNENNIVSHGDGTATYYDRNGEIVEGTDHLSNDIIKDYLAEQQALNEIKENKSFRKVSSFYEDSYAVNDNDEVDIGKASLSNYVAGKGTLSLLTSEELQELKEAIISDEDGKYTATEGTDLFKIVQNDSLMSRYGDPHEFLSQLLADIERYEKNPATLEDQDQERKRMFINAQSSDVQSILTSLDLDETATKEEIENGIKFAQNVADQNSISVKLGVVDSIKEAFASGDFETVQKQLGEDYTKFLEMSEEEREEYLNGLEESTNNILKTASFSGVKIAKDEKTRAQVNATTNRISANNAATVVDSMQDDYDTISTKNLLTDEHDWVSYTTLEGILKNYQNTSGAIASDQNDYYTKILTDYMTLRSSGTRDSLNQGVESIALSDGTVITEDGQWMEAVAKYETLLTNMVAGSIDTKTGESTGRENDADTVGMAEHIFSVSHNDYSYFSNSSGDNYNAKRFIDMFMTEQLEGYSNYDTAVDNKKTADTAATESETALTTTEDHYNTSLENYIKYEQHMMEKLSEQSDDLGLDDEKINIYADSLTEMSKSGKNAISILRDNKIALQETAQQIARLNKGYSDLTENWDTLSQKLNSDNFVKQKEALAELSDIAANFLNIDKNLISDNWIKNGNTQTLLNQIANGDASAITDLRLSFVEQYAEEVLSKNGLTESLKSEINDFINNTDFDNLELGANLNDADFITGMNDLLAKAQISVDEVNTILSGMGYNPEIEWKEVTITNKSQAAAYGKLYNSAGEEVSVGGDYDFSANSTFYIPTINAKQSVYSGPPEATASSSSDSGSSSPAEKVDRTKKSDVVNRYEEIEDKLDDIRDAADRASGAMDRLYGGERIAEMKKQANLLKQEVGLLKDKKTEAEKYLKEDTASLAKAATEAGVRFEFDEKGNVTNYTEQMTRLYDQLAAAEAHMDTLGTKEEQDDYQETHVQPIQDAIDALKEEYDGYEETRELIEDLDTEIQEAIYAWQDANAEILNYEIELQVEMDERELQKIEYYLGKMEDDFYSSAESAALLGEKIALTQKSLTNNENNIARLKQMYDAGEISQAAYIEGLKEEESKMYDNLQTLQEYDKEMMNYYGETLDKAQEELTSYTDKMEHATSVLDHYRSLLDLTGQSHNFKAIGTVLEGQAKTIENSYRVAKENYEWLADEAVKKKQAMNDALARGDAEAAEFYENEWKAAEERMRESQDNMLSMAEEWAGKLKEVLENKLAEIADVLENALTGGRSFDELSMQMEHAQGIQEEYLTTTNKIYETNKMIRNAQNEIDKTTNTVAKQKLKAFQQETQQLQNQNQLSQFELDIQQKKYDLLLAEIALEEAQNAKSTVRLQRDSEGNFGYVYTADQNQVSEAEQGVEDAENALYNTRLEGANNYASQRQELLQGLYDGLANLDNQYYIEGVISEEEYNRQKEAIQSYYFKKLAQNSELYAIATGEDATISQEAWSTSLGIMDEDASNLVEAVDNYLFNSRETFNEYQININKVAKETGVDLQNLASNVQIITDKSNELKDEVVNEVIPALQDELDKVSEVTGNYALHREELALVMESYEDLLTDVGNVITKMGGLADECNSVEQQAKEAAAAIGQLNTIKVVPGDGSGNGALVGDYYVDGTTGKTRKIIKNTLSTAVLQADGYYKRPNGEYIKQEDMIYSGEIDASGKRLYYILEGASSFAKSGSSYHYVHAFDTGGYTGEWGPEGKWALLHQKELVLNATQTEDLLMTMELLDSIIKQIDMMTMNNKVSQMNAAMNEAVNAMYREQMAQEVHIEVNFPNATDRNEIYQALEMLANDASQFINR